MKVKPLSTVLTLLRGFTRKSSNLKAYHYDKYNQVLYIKFHNNVVWAYKEVSSDTMVAFLGADSLGSFFHAGIKAKHEAQQV